MRADQICVKYQIPATGSMGDSAQHGNVANCLYCKRPLSEGEKWGHGACEAELGRRCNAGKCAYCGKNAEGDQSWCAKCGVANNRQYVGYPPGGV